MTDGAKHPSNQAATPVAALTVTNTLAAWYDADRAGPRASSDAAGRRCGAGVVRGDGWLLAGCGPHASIAVDATVACVAIGEPRFEDSAADAVARSGGTAAAWLASYQSRGLEAFNSAHGGWSAVIIDFGQRLVAAAVDRFAIHPLCYLRTGAALGLASRADQVPGGVATLDPQAIYDYVYHHFIPAPRTIWTGVYRLDGAHRMVASARNIDVQRYWQPEFADRPQPIAERKRAFLAALEEAVGAQLAPSTGCYLSGGTDSSTVAGMATRVAGRPVRTYSIGFDAAGYDEMHYARIAARHFRTEHREYYVTPRDLVERIPDVAAFYDQPFGNSSALPALFCATMARADGVDRLLAGDGGDELFGGNSRYASDKLFTTYERVPESIRGQLIEPLALGLPLRSVPVLRKVARYVEIARMPLPSRLQLHNLLDRIGPSTVFTPEFLAGVDPREPHRRELATYAATPPAATLDRMLAYEWKYVLADNDLVKVTGTATLGGVEVGFPLLDHRLVDLSLALPPELKVRGRALRYFFKEALRGFLPDDILTKKKHGFGLPFGVWANRDPDLRALAVDSIRGLARRGVVRADFIDRLIAEQLPQHPGYYGEMVWILMMLEQWLRCHPSTPWSGLPPRPADERDNPMRDFGVGSPA